jgi:hypothetical protein
MLRKLRRLSKFSPAELFILLQLGFFALIARVSLRFVALPCVTALIAACVKNPFLRWFPLFENAFELSQLTRLADIAARIARPDGPCLLRSLLLFWLLKVRREPADLVIGVAKEATGLNSHAWIESRGCVLGDSEENTLRFATLLRF